jgi:hypothetical protein
MTHRRERVHDRESPGVREARRALRVPRGRPNEADAPPRGARPRPQLPGQTTIDEALCRLCGRWLAGDDVGPICGDCRHDRDDEAGDEPAGEEKA